MQVNLQRQCVNLASLVFDTTVCLLSYANKNVKLLDESVVNLLRSIAEDLKQHFSPAGKHQ